MADIEKMAMKRSVISTHPQFRLNIFKGTRRHRELCAKSSCIGRMNALKPTVAKSTLLRKSGKLGPVGVVEFNIALRIANPD